MLICRFTSDENQHASPVWHEVAKYALLMWYLFMVPFCSKCLFSGIYNLVLEMSFKLEFGPQVFRRKLALSQLCSQ